VVFLTYFACRKEWRLVLGGAAAAAVVGLMGIGVLGWRIHEEFFRTVLGNHLVGKLSMQDPFTASFQSFDSLFRRLFLFDAVNNPSPLLAAPWLQVLAVVAVKASIFAAAIGTLMKLNRNWPEEAVAPSVGIIGVLALLLAPATASYHFVLLWLPVGLLVAYFIQRHAPAVATAVVLIYAGIGFFPYRITAMFEGRGGLSVLAYPRLWLLTMILGACLYFIPRRIAPIALPAGMAAPDR
jgi:hypothetical protein